MSGNSVLSVACAVFIGVGALAFAPVAQADEIAQRKAAMKSNSTATKILGGTAKGEMAFDGKAIAAAGYQIANNLIAAGTLFPAGSMGGKSRAKAEIWQDMAGFTAALANAKKAALAVAAAGTANDEAAFKAAVGGVGKGCKGCHEKFRAPKKKK